MALIGRNADNARVTERRLERQRKQKQSVKMEQAILSGYCKAHGCPQKLESSWEQTSRRLLIMFRERGPSTRAK